MSLVGFDRAFEKQPSEQLTIRGEFADAASKLAVSGYAMNAAEVKVYDSSGQDKSTDMINGTPSIDTGNHYVFVCLKGGTAGSDYSVRFRLTYTKTAQPDQIFERDLLLNVRQKGFA